MSTIWKYPLASTGENKISIPKGARILACQLQDETPCLWVVVDTDRDTEYRTFLVLGTGWTVEENWDYIATFQHGPFVWHVFERKA